MEFEHKAICRLCLKVVTNEFVEIDEVMTQTFDILSLNLDLNITRDPIICWDCLKVAKKCIKFKLICCTTERIILSFSADGKNAKHNIKVIYKKSEYIETQVDEDLDICRICMARLGRNNFAFLETLRNEMTVFKIPDYLPELDFNFIDNPMICTTCRENLNLYLNFVMKSLDTEWKIKAFCKEEGTDRMDQVNLGNVLHFSFKDILERPEKSPQTCAIKGELYTFEDTECVYPKGYDGLIKLEELNIKEEEINLKEKPYKNQLEMGLDKYKFLSKELDKESISHTIPLKTREENAEKSTYRKISYRPINKYTVSTNKRQQQSNLKRDLITSMGTSEPDIYKYNLHTYEGTEKSLLKNHINIHEEPSDCKGKTHIKDNKMYKCSLCTYEAKRKSSLKEHILVHKGDSKMKTHKCLLCDYETNRKDTLKTHMLVHKDVSELTMYKCSLCEYTTKYKGRVKLHMLIHKDVSQLKMYKCSLCTYETKYKSSLKNHMFVHKDVSEIKMHRCRFCAFETKLNKNLHSHMLVHKDVSQVKMNKCSLCAYETKRKSNLKSHMLVHKDISELKTYKCSLCPYEAKSKSKLNRHMIVHKNSSEIQMYECPLCAYKFKYKSSLKSHTLVHKKSSETEMYECSMCAFKSKYKSSLKLHMLVHKDISEITHVST